MDRSYLSAVLALALLWPLVGCGVAAEQTISYDDGGAVKTTVLGRFAPEQTEYMLGADFSLMWSADLKRSAVLVHIHVGSQINPVTGQSEPKLLLRVNDSATIEKPLADVERDKNIWIEVEVPVDAWKVGINRVQVDSNVNNTGNMSAESVDIISATNAPFTGRTWYSTDGGRIRKHQRYRNIGIRLKLERKESEAVLTRLEVGALTDQVGINEPVQVLAKAFDTGGKPANPGALTWSAEGATIDAGGFLLVGRPGSVEIKAAVGDLLATASVTAVLKPPFGIEPPDSPKRLGSRIPAGHHGLSGKWDFVLDPENRGVAEKWYAAGGPARWGEIVVPGCWQAQGYGIDYHGVAWYRREFTVPREWKDREVWLRFGAAATSATVWLNGKRVGHHLGNWVPFEFDISPLVKRDAPNKLVVQVDELPTHFSAGFSREVGKMAGTDSHFGGLWQDVSLFQTGPAHVSSAYVVPNLPENMAEIRAEILSRTSDPLRIVATVLDKDGREVARRQIPFQTAKPITDRWTHPEEVRMTLAIPQARKWSPDDPYLYNYKLQVYSGEQVADSYEHRFGMRSIERQGHQILLNGEPLFVRGALHWAYYPDLFSIDPSEDTIRKEFAELRASGFNMVKPCLLMFPPRFYEIADETGMLLWQEYPTWLYLQFPKEGDNRLRADFEREYPEWFRFERRYTSIILRDLTCEAHDGSNWELLKDIYKVAKYMTGGALICDNSSFLNHAITDWYDCHIYRDLDAFYEYVDELVAKMRTKSDVLPYLSGEDLDADTYRDSAAISQKFIQGEIPWWLDNHNFRSQLKYDENLSKDVSPDAPAKLVLAQNRHALALRKAYMEEFRRHPELTGYIMTQIRDITVTRPGFYDDLGEQKWSPEAWNQFNSDRVLTLQTKGRSHVFSAAEPLEAELLLSNFGPELSGSPVTWKLTDGDRVLAQGEAAVNAKRGTIQKVAPVRVDLPALTGASTAPLTCKLSVQIGENGSVAKNDWNLWVFPELPQPADAQPQIYGYSTTQTEGLLNQFSRWNIKPWQHDAGTDGLLITDTLDEKVTGYLESGGRALLVARDEVTTSFPRQEAPFWRETVITIPKTHLALGDFPHEEFVDLQFLDLTQRKPFVLDKGAREKITPIIWGTSARNAGNPVYDYLFEQKIGKGHLVACCLKLSGDKNIAGQHLLSSLIKYASGNEAF